MKSLTKIIALGIISGAILTGCGNSENYESQYRNTPYKVKTTCSKDYERIVLTDTTRNDENYHPTITGVKLNGAWHEIRQWNLSPNDPMEKYANADSLNKIINYRGE